MTSTRTGINEFLADAHAAGLSQKQADVALQALARAQSESMREMQKHAQQTAQRTGEALQREHGRGWIEKQELANRWAQDTWGQMAPDVMKIGSKMEAV